MGLLQRSDQHPQLLLLQPQPLPPPQKPPLPPQQNRMRIRMMIHQQQFPPSKQPQFISHNSFSYIVFGTARFELSRITYYAMGEIW